MNKCTRRMKRDEDKAARKRAHRLLTPGTYWNGERCTARRVRVIVGESNPRGAWYEGLEGTARDAVEVLYGDMVYYLDNEDGSGWLKVTKGRGSPGVSSRFLSIRRVLRIIE